MTNSKTKEFFYVTDEWSGFLVDRVRGSTFGYSGHGFCICDVQTFLRLGRGYIEQSCGFSNFLRSLLVKERIDTISSFKGDHVLKL